MDEYIRLNNATAGKDKIARLFQYLSRLIWYSIQKKKLDPSKVDKLKALEYTLSTFRKLLRLGKSMEVLYLAQKTIHHEDIPVRLTVTMSKISTAIFLLTDHVLWFGRSGLATVDIPKWTETSNKYWLYSISLNLARDFYEIMKILEHETFDVRLSRRANVNVMYKNCLSVTGNLIGQHKAIFWDTVKNICDVWIPLNALGYTKLSPGLIGLLGTISSVAGLVSIMNPEAKLNPS